MSDVSDLLLEFYKANLAKTPKTQEAALLPQPATSNSPSKEKNLQVDEMMLTQTPNIVEANATAVIKTNANNNNSVINASFHQENGNNTVIENRVMTAIPTSVVVPPKSPQIDVKPLIHPTSGLIISTAPAAVTTLASTPTPTPISVIKPVLAAALLEPPQNNTTVPTTKLLENFLLRQQREQRLSDECDDTNSDANDGDDEDDSRYNGFEDIHLVEGSAGIKAHLSNLTAGDYLSDESQKYMMAAQAQALRQLEYSLGDFTAGCSNGAGSAASVVSNDAHGGMEPVYECRHCGKKYRWKSTLRRHENVECGGKEPSHQCPYCPYKSKQRGNLGVHVRKHHSNLPQLASKRRSKYSQKLEGEDNIAGVGGGFSSTNVSDDSSSKLIIDCSK